LRPLGRGCRTLQAAKQQPQERAVETVQVAKQITHGAIHKKTSLYFSASIISPLAAKVKRKAQILFRTARATRQIARPSPPPRGRGEKLFGKQNKKARQTLDIYWFF
jgi:hypothetical protein